MLKGLDLVKLKVQRMGKYKLRDKLAEALIEDEVQEIIHGDALLP